MSNGAVATISVIISCMVSVVITATISILVTTRYYNNRYNKMQSITQQQIPRSNTLVYEEVNNTGNVIMTNNPAYGEFCEGKPINQTSDYI